MMKLRLPLLATLLFATNAANATLITVDPSFYAAGTDLSHIAPGLTLSAMSNAGYSTDEPEDVTPRPQTLFSPIIAVESNDYHSSAMMFGQASEQWGNNFAYEGMAARYLAGESGRIFPFSVFRADFESGTNFVQMVVGGCCHGDYARIDYWGLDGSFIGTCSTPAGRAEHDEGCHVVNIGDLSKLSPDNTEPWLISWTSPTANIGFVTSGGWAGWNDVRQITYNRVPEPGTFGLLALSLLGLAFLRRRAASGI